MISTTDTTAKTAFFTAIATITVTATMPAPASAQALHPAENFLTSLHSFSRVQAPRLGLSALHTFLAHPSHLEKWGVMAANAAASYNSLTNTLILKPEMTVDDPGFGGHRVKTLLELNQTLGDSSHVTAGVILHEMSHAEWDLYVEEEEEVYDRKLMKVMRAEVPRVAEANGLSIFKAQLLPSEIFAYYREDLLNAIMSDTNEIHMSSGIHPHLFTCTRVLKRPAFLRNFSPSDESYVERAKLGFAYVLGQEVDLSKAPESFERIHRALVSHTRATLQFPENRTELLKILGKDRRRQQAVADCLRQNSGQNSVYDLSP